MLSTKVLQSVGSSKSYFLGQDDYYLRDAIDIYKNQWLGQGAKKLGLDGSVDPRVFERLLSGILPNGDQLGKTQNGKIQHRPGFDLTFSAPKSVSILAEIGQDARIYKAHDKAVETAIAYIERSCAQARKTVLGKTGFENTQNLIVAIFKHDTSRKLDPQLHTHAVVMNVTQRVDGKWRSLASDKFGYADGANGFIERVRHNKVYFGAIYRSVLAYELKLLGYEIVKTHIDGRFEIAGVPTEVLKHFSQRREEIQDFLKEKGWDGSKAADFVTLETRTRKENVSPELLHKVWLERSLQLGFDPQEMIRGLEKKDPQPYISTDNAEVAMDYAMQHLSERDVRLSQHKLVNVAATHAIGEVSFPNIIGAMEKLIDNKTLIPLESKGDKYYTTAELLKAETHLIDIAMRNRNSVSFLNAVGKKGGLSSEQFRALKNIASSTDRFVAIDGISGSGKTTVLDSIHLLAKESGLQVFNLTPTQAQAKDWYQRSGFSTDTISSFLKKDKPVDVILIDNAQLVSARQLSALFDKVESLNARAILAGDTRAYLPIEAGAPFAQLIKSGLKTEVLTKIQREQQFKGRVNAAFKGDMDRALSKVKVIEQPDEKKRFLAIAEHYVSLRSTDRQSTLILMPNKKECGNVNDIIHKKLQENGELRGKHEVLDIYLSRSMTKAELCSAKNYAVGNVVRFNTDLSELKVSKGEYQRISSIDAVSNSLYFGSENKAKQLFLDRTLNIEVFNHEQREIIEGEKIQVFRSKQGITSGDILTVKEIKARNLTVVTDSGNKLKFNRKDLSNFHFDYAYSMTPYRAQHLSLKVVIAHNSSEHFATNQRSFYKELAQSTKETYLYTGNREAILNKLRDQTGDKSNALDAVFQQTIINPREQVTLLENRLEQILINLKAPVDHAKEAIEYALAHLSEREAAFNHKELLAVAISHVLGEVPLDKLEQAILLAQTSGAVVRGQKASEGTYWTTQEEVSIENHLLKLAKNGQGQVVQISSLAKVEERLSESTLRAEQRDVVKALSTTQDRIVLVQGYAGVGKTTMLVSFKNIAEEEGYKICGLAPSHTAVSELSSRGISAQTLQSFLVESEKGAASERNKTIYVLDEASMVSNRDMLDLIKSVNAQNARFIAVGDKDQLASPEAGKPFVLLQQSGIKTLVLSEVHRQNPDKQELREAVKSIIEKDFAKAFTSLEKQSTKPQIIEIANKEERLQTMVDDYLSRSPVARTNALVITPLNADRVLVNDMIRDGLKTEGLIASKGEIFSIWVPRHLSRVELTHIANYQVGDTIRFNRTIYSLGVSKNSYLEVVGLDTKLNALSLKQGEKTLFWQPLTLGCDKRGSVEIYSKEKRELCVGDQVIWSRTDKNQDLVNGIKGKVVRVSSENISLELENGSTKNLNARVPNSLHWDHAYAVTAYAAQGKTKAEVLDHEDSTFKRLTNQKSFYVSVTRAQQQVTIYTDNKAELLKRVQRNTGEKWSALELIGKPPKSTAKTWDIKDIQQRLVDKAEHVVKEILGEPLKKTDHEWRYGSHKGSLIVTMQGPKRGLWYDFQQGEGGDLLKLIAHKYNHDNRELARTLNVSAQVLGLSESHKILVASNKDISKNKTAKKELTDYQKQSIAKAEKLWEESQPAIGTLVEKYLREHRGIAKPLPEDIRFHPKVYSERNGGFNQALLSACRDSKGKIQAVQATYLDPKTSNKAEVEVKKQVFGVLKGSVVTVQKGDSSKPTLVCEGIETGLSLREIDKEKTIQVTLGVANFKSIYSESKNVIFCLDNDGDNPAVKKLIQNVCEIFTKAGKNVFLSQPKEINKDYNDMLRGQGREAVKKALSAAIPFKSSPLDPSKIESRKNQDLKYQAQKKLDKQSRDKIGFPTTQSSNLQTITDVSSKTVQKLPNIIKVRIRDIEQAL